MNQNSSLLMTNFHCGLIFQKENQEFLIICVLCNKEFNSYSIFTDHLVHKICSSNVTPLLQQTLKIEKDIIGNLLVQPKIEPLEIDNKNQKKQLNDEFSKKWKPKIEPIEIESDNYEERVQMDISSNSINQNVTIAAITTKELTKISPKKPIKRTRIIKKKIIWDPDDPKIQLLCENYQNRIPKNQTKKSKEILHPPTPSNQITQLPNNLQRTNLHNSNQLLVKTFQKQSRIGSTPRISEKTKTKKIKRIKKVIWDPDAPEEDLYKSKTNIDRT